MKILEELEAYGGIALREMTNELIRERIKGLQVAVHPFIFVKSRTGSITPIWLQLSNSGIDLNDMLNSMAFHKPLPNQTLEHWRELQWISQGYSYRRANAIGLLELVKAGVIPTEGGDSVIVFHAPINQSEFLFTFWAESDKAAREFVMKRFDEKKDAVVACELDFEKERQRLFE